jgi:hypothetical protein
MKIKYIKTTSIISIITLMVSFLFSLYKGFSWLAYIDILFLTSLVILIIGLFMFVCIGGFFDAITFTFRRVASSLSKRAELRKDDLESMALPSEVFSTQFMMGFLMSGLALTVISIIIGFFL